MKKFNNLGDDKLLVMLAEKCADVSLTALKMSQEQNAENPMTGADKVLLFDKLFNAVLFALVLLGIKLDPNGAYCAAAIGKKLDSWKSQLVAKDEAKNDD